MTNAREYRRMKNVLPFHSNNLNVRRAKLAREECLRQHRIRRLACDMKWYAAMILATAPDQDLIDVETAWRVLKLSVIPSAQPIRMKQRTESRLRHQR